jgi:hypothetical protein
MALSLVSDVDALLTVEWRTSGHDDADLDEPAAAQGPGY